MSYRYRYMQYNSVFALILRIALLCVLQVSHGGAALQVQHTTAVLDFDILAPDISTSMWTTAELSG